MTTPRQPAWFRTTDALARHRQLTPDAAFLYLRLCAFLNTRWSREAVSAEEAGECVVSRDELIHLTGYRRIDKCRRSLDDLQLISDITWRSLGDDTEISFPKWSEFQGISARKSPPTKTKTKTKTLRTPSVCDAQAPDGGESPPPSQAKPSPQPLGLPGLEFASEPPDPAPEWLPLANMLAKLPGETDEKHAWLEAEYGNLWGRSQAEERPIGSLAVAFYNHYLKGDREYQGIGRKLAGRAAAKAKIAKLLAEPPPEHDPDLMAQLLASGSKVGGRS